MIALVQLLAVIASTGVPAAAKAPSPGCGAVVTRDFVLRGDLDNCPGAGLVVGAPGITIDLAGHNIDSAADDMGSQPAVDNLDGHDFVTLKNGTSTDYLWTYGAERADHFRVHGLEGFPGAQVIDSSHGRVTDSYEFGGVNVDHSRLIGNVLVNLDRSAHNLITGTEIIRLFEGSNRNRVVRNSPDSFKPIWIWGSHRNLVRHNTFDNSAEPIFLSGGASRNLIEHNTVSGGTEFTYAITLFEAHRNIVRHNVVTDSRLFDGFRSGGGVVLCGARGNLIEDNSFTDQFVGIGMDNDSSCDEDLVSRSNTLRRNTVSRSDGSGYYPELTGDGITIGARSLGTRVIANTVRDNRHHGIHARSPSTTLTRNTALDNARLGIKAVAGVIDGGGNAAQGNGDVRECVGVVCGRARPPDR